MWLRQRSPDGARQGSSGLPQISDLGSQLEDLIMHVFRCEQWARFDDRIALSLAVEQLRPRRPRRRR